MDKHIIKKIVEASGLSKGELILIHFWGEDTSRQVADDFAVAVAASGATPFVLQQSRSKNRELFEVVEQSCFDDRYFSIFSKFDAVLVTFPAVRFILHHRRHKPRGQYISINCMLKM